MNELAHIDDQIRRRSGAMQEAVAATLAVGARARARVAVSAGLAGLADSAMTGGAHALDTVAPEIAVLVRMRDRHRAILSMVADA